MTVFYVHAVLNDDDDDSRASLQSNQGGWEDAVERMVVVGRELVTC